MTPEELALISKTASDAAESAAKKVIEANNVKVTNDLDSLKKSTDENTALVKTPGAIVALHGPCGTGKTVMASSIARGLTRLGRSCRYSKAYDFCLALRQDEKAREKGVMSRFKRPYFLVLDEFHELKRSDFAAYSIDRLVDARFQSGKPTCIISNLRAEEVEPALGPAIVSRMHEAGGVITCEWSSFRELREEAEQGG